jgi:hypothetical protein
MVEISFVSPDFGDINSQTLVHPSFAFSRVDNPLTRVLFNPMTILCSGTSAFGTSGLWVSTGGKTPEEKLLGVT